MACCNKIYDLGCLDSCGVLSFGSTDEQETVTGVFTSSGISVSQTVFVEADNPYQFALNQLNENAEYTLSLFNQSGTKLSISINDVLYDCFTFKTQILGTPTTTVIPQGCTPICKEVGILVDGETVFGNGVDVPLSAVGGGGSAVDSVNSQTGVVVLDADDISDATTTNKFTNTTEKNTWNGKQDALGFTPENVANKTDAVTGNEANSTKYLSVKGVYDWVTSLGYITISALTGYATQSWVNAQGFITNVISALGYTPANKAGDTFTGSISATNLSGTNTGDNAVNSLYSGLVTNANHSGEVAGSGALTIQKEAITNRTLSTIVGGDSILFSDASDSDNLKKGLVSDIIAAASGGGASLSGLTAATAANTIDNVANTQTWQWNSLAGQNAIALSSSSPLAASNLQNILSISQTGVNATAIQTTFGARISNTKTGVNSTNIGLQITATGATANIPLSVVGVNEIIRIDGSSLSSISNYIAGVLRCQTGYIADVNTYFIKPADAVNGRIYLGASSEVAIEKNRLGVGTNPSYPLHVSGTAVSGRIARFENGYIESVFASDIPFLHSRAGNFGSFGLNSSGNLIMGVSNSATVFQFSISATNNNVGIGTVTPNASARLEVTSTTQGFRLTPMTATQASAITPVEGLMVFTSNTNGTFTSIGLWCYENGSWSKK